MSSRSKLSSVLASTSTTTLELVAWLDMEAVGALNHSWRSLRSSANHGYFHSLRAVIFGPAATQWYKLLARINLSSPITTTIARVGADQCIFATAHVGLFLSSMAYLEGESPQQRLESSYFTALKMNWTLWPIVQTVNFNFVPLNYRTLVVNAVSIPWNSYLSYVNSQGSAKKKTATQ